jgi:hypothetical protein
MNNRRTDGGLGREEQTTQLKKGFKCGLRSYLMFFKLRL